MNLFPVRGSVSYCLIVTIFTIINVLFLLFNKIKQLFSPNKKCPENFEEIPSCFTDPSLGVHGDLELKSRGISIHYVANGSSSKPLMLFLHGFPDFWYSWKYQLTEFSNDYYAVAIDMVGYGKSSAPKDVTRYSIEEISQDIKEFVSELGYSCCVLVGIDWGAIIAFGTAIDYPEVVHRLVVMNGPHPTAIYNNESFSQLLMSFYIGFFQVPCLPEFILSNSDYEVLDMLKGHSKNNDIFDDETIHALKYNFHLSGMTGPLNYYRMLMSPSDVTPKDVEVPSLLIWGTEDKVIGIEMARNSAQYMKKGQVVYIDGSSHFVNHDKPAEVNKHMRDFLENE